MPDHHRRDLVRWVEGDQPAAPFERRRYGDRGGLEAARPGEDQSVRGAERTVEAQQRRFAPSTPCLAVVGAETAPAVRLLVEAAGLPLAERVSIRNLHLIIEAIAEIAPHVRRTEQIVEHVRIRMAQQICGDLSTGGRLKVLRLGNRWDLAFHQSLKRDPKGEVREFDIDPRQLEEFGKEASNAIRSRLDAGEQFVLVTAPEARPYVRMIIERLFPNLPVLSHVEVARGVELQVLGTIS